MTAANMPSPSYKPLDVEALRSMEAIEPTLVNSLLYGLIKHRDIETVENVIAAGLLGEPGAELTPVMHRARILVNSVSSPDAQSRSFAELALEKILVAFAHDADWKAGMLGYATRVGNKPLMERLFAAGADPHRPVLMPLETPSATSRTYRSAAVEAMLSDTPLTEQTSRMFAPKGRVRLTAGIMAEEGKKPVRCTTLLDQAMATGRADWVQVIVQNLEPGEENRRAMSDSLAEAIAGKNTEVAAGLLCIGAEPHDGEAGWKQLTGLRKIRKDEPGSLAADIIISQQYWQVAPTTRADIATKAIQVLLDKGLNPNLTDRLDRTLLGAAVANGNPGIVSALLMAGADVSPETRSNSYEELAEMCAQPHLIPLLQSWKAREVIGKVLRDATAAHPV